MADLADTENAIYTTDMDKFWWYANSFKNVPQGVAV